MPQFNFVRPKFKIYCDQTIIFIVTSPPKKKNNNNNLQMINLDGRGVLNLKLYCFHIHI